MLSQAQTMANKLFSPKNKLRLGGAKKRQPRLEAEQQQAVTITMTASHPPKAMRYVFSSLLLRQMGIV